MWNQLKLAGLIVLATAFASYLVLSAIHRRQAAEQEATLDRLEARLDTLQRVAATAQQRDTVWRITVDSLRQVASGALARGRTPGTLPPRPIAPSPADCAPWVVPLEAEVADLTRRNGELDLAAVTALEAEAAATMRADSAIATVDSLRRGIGQVGDTLAARPGRVRAPRRQSLQLTATAGLRDARLAAGLRRGLLFVELEQRVPLSADAPPAERSLRVGVQLVL